MPTVGARRSTRVFVPKHHGDPARVLRSGKRFALSMSKESDANQWSGPDLNRWWLDERKIEWEGERVEIEKKEIKEQKKFGTVYSRKRPRSTLLSYDSWNPPKVRRRFGIVFERKVRRKEQKATPLLASKPMEFRIAECSRIFVEKLGILDVELFDRVERSNWVILAVVVDCFSSYSLDRFQRFLVSVMKRMMRERAELWDLVVLLCCRSIRRVLAENGVHFLPIRLQANRIWDRNSFSGYGFCKIYGAGNFVPVLSVDYSAIPSYFKCLHALISLQSQYLPSVLQTEHLVPTLENSLMVVPRLMHSFGKSEAKFAASETPVVGNELPTIGGSFAPDSCSSVVVTGSRLQKHQKRRRSCKNKNNMARRRSSMRSGFGSFHYNRNSSSVSLMTKRKFPAGLISVKPPDSCLSDLFSARDECDVTSSPGSCSNVRKSSGVKSPIEKIKEMRLSLAEVRQNIDSACCNANILVTDAEKCWREDGARVMLETSSAQEWFIAVKKGDVTRFLHKPQDLRLCVVNRYTHAYMWSGDDGWKLEFCDKWDWLVFKELHMECRDRNVQDVSVKVIPVPGVREVSGYEDDAMSSFIRPDIYIHIMNDEVGRALASEASYYDMDSADEEWLRHLNSSLPDALPAGSSYISEETFEKIVFALEKDAYSHPDNGLDKEKALDLCHELGTRNMVSAIYDYWLKKRKQRHQPLARVFQSAPLRRRTFIQKPVLRKKRSFKRQRSQAERNQIECNQAWGSKPDLLLQAHEVAVRKVEEADAAARRAAEIATQLRARAQLLMANADLAAYKAAMSLRIAEAIQLSPSSSSSTCELDSSILFD